AFASHMFHGSHQLARMKYGMDLGDLIEEAGREAKTTRSPVRSGLVVEQAKKNHDYVMNPTSNRIAQMATQGAFMWYLAQSPAAALVNMSQTFTVAPAKLAAFHDKGAAVGIPVALGQLNKAMFDLGMGRTFAEKSPRVTPAEKAAVQEAYRFGLITRTQSHDVAGIGDSGIKYSPVRAKLMAAMSFMFHHTERINREATFLAGYRMARRRGLDQKNAIRKAAELTWDSHYDYQNSSRPAVMHSNTGKALLVFRNYSMNMLADLAYTAYEMINPRNKQERKEARTQMLGLGATLAFNAGIRGLPLYGLLMMIAGMFTDDGEDPEVELKKTLLQHLPKPMVGMMMDGVPGYLSGTELSGRMGFGDLWFRSDDMDREGDEQYLYWMQQVMGAAAGVPYNWYRGMSQISDGYTWRGIETMAPKAIKDPMKAYRYYSEGVATKNGDPIVDDVGGWNVAKQALGFTPAKVTEQYKLNSYNMNKQKEIVAERSKLLGDFYKAWKSGDEKQSDQIIDKMRTYSEKYPEMRIDGDAVRSSLTRREKYRGSALGGMNYNQKLVPRLQDEQPGSVYR
ncbi:PLxRFG domain-containing protein, partial [Leclercia sp.]|uniref:PLxRFG domain-containing protein n=1 Tax=Leclercia sp. TaxID=1898428 RepID=UPI0028BD912C